MGDSKTQENEFTTWPTTLAASIRTATGSTLNLKNYGANGTTVAVALGNLAGLFAAANLPPSQPNMVLINFGVNDGIDTTNATARTAWENNYIALIDATVAAYPLTHFWLMRP